MSPFTNSSCIQIRLTRDGNTHHDDRIVIYYEDDNIYRIFFQDGEMKSKTTYCTILTGEELDVYIESLFTLLVRDNDPFENINFIIPCFPVMQYDIQALRGKKLRSTLKRLMPILKSSMKCY